MPTSALAGTMERTEVMPETTVRRGARVLVVEDDDDMRAWVSELLREEGYEVVSARDALTGLMHHMHEPAALVVTDWKMPGLDGLRLLNALRRTSPEVQVIMVTAYPDEASVSRVQDAGAFSCLSKPFRSGQLLAHVQAALLCAGLERPRQSGGARGARAKGAEIPRA